jgi:hypothetical protein
MLLVMRWLDGHKDEWWAFAKQSWDYIKQNWREMWSRISLRLISQDRRINRSENLVKFSYIVYSTYPAIGLQA